MLVFKGTVHTDLWLFLIIKDDHFLALTGAY